MKFGLERDGMCIIRGSNRWTWEEFSASDDLPVA